MARKRPINLETQATPADELSRIATDLRDLKRVQRKDRADARRRLADLETALDEQEETLAIIADKIVELRLAITTGGSGGHERPKSLSDQLRADRESASRNTA